MKRSSSSRAGVTLVELVLVIFVLLVLAAILFPAFAKAPEGRRRSCASHSKQIALALLQYTQDYDDRLPPALGHVRVANGDVFPSDWALDYSVSAVTVPSTIAAYVKNQGVFKCPDLKKSGPLTYLYNDLAAGQQLTNLPGAASSVLVAEGEDQANNVGHAWTPNAAPEPATFTPAGGVEAGRGATVQTAPTRHSDGANYAFLDGHVKWHKPSLVFFPPRASSSPKREGALESVPGGDMKGYAATFRVR